MTLPSAIACQLAKNRQNEALLPRVRLTPQKSMPWQPVSQQLLANRQSSQTQLDTSRAQQKLQSRYRNCSVTFTSSLNHLFRLCK